MEIKIKDPESRLDYPFNWADWLDTSTTPYESIVDYTITVPPGLTLYASELVSGENSSGITVPDSVVVAWLKDGTAEERYQVECLIETSAGRIDEYSFLLKVIER